MNDQQIHDALRTALPAWQKDALGIRGNPIDYHRQQAQIHFEPSSVVRRQNLENSGDIQPATSSSTPATPPPEPIVPTPPPPSPTNFPPSPPPVDVPPDVVALQQHNSYGTPSGFFADFHIDVANVYDKITLAFIGSFDSNSWGPTPIGGTEAHFGVVFLRQVPDDILTGDPGPYPPANAGKTVTVYV